MYIFKTLSIACISNGKAFLVNEDREWFDARSLSSTFRYKRYIHGKRPRRAHGHRLVLQICCTLNRLYASFHSMLRCPLKTRIEEPIRIILPSESADDILSSPFNLQVAFVHFSDDLVDSFANT